MPSGLCTTRSSSVPRASSRSVRSGRRRGERAGQARGGEAAMTEPVRVAVVGATGVVGTTMLELLRQRDFPASEVVPFATERSAGRELEGGLTVRALNEAA